MRSIRTMLGVVAVAVSLSVCPAQTGPSVDELLRLLSSDDESAIRAAGLLADHPQDPRVIPALRANFQRSTVKKAKQSTALALIKMQVQDQIYFHYLASFASEAIENDAPVAYRLNGRQQDYQNITPEFAAWCKAHGTTVEEEIRKEQFEQAMDLLLLTAALDKRAAPLLRKGLQAKRPLVVSICAGGLGALQDPSDIPRIFEAAYRSNEDIDLSIVKGLACYTSSHDRDEILKLLRGSRLYESYMERVKALDFRRQMGIRKN